MPLTGNDIREKFLKFFESKGHEIVPSASLIPTNDPTLMFTAAGMVQFKNVFTGAEKRAYTRATSSQRCVRAGGKHNDLENVGHTARHHTFFEMLGNFSFGDYFKEDAIPFAWEFLTSKEWMGLPQDKLYITIYHTDDEAYALWKKIWNDAGYSDEQIEAQDRIIKIATSDNFWSAGDTGPCGPCTEIFYDHGEEYFGDKPGTPDEDGDRFIEIWNVVFMQYDKQADGEMKPLPKTGVDTGCGLERLTAVMQGVNSNYDTDLMQTLIKASTAIVGKDYFSQDDKNCTPEQKDTSDSYRVIADHLRAMCFLMVDGVMPSNEGRGYVLRRIMRRAMRHVNLLGMNEPMIYKLVPALVQAMGEKYPELTRAQTMVSDLIKLEEERFLKTLKNGLKLLEDESVGLKEGDELAGEVAFKLQDTYGFPIDLTQDILAKRKIDVDMEAYEASLEEAKEKSRAGGTGGTGQTKLAPVWFDVADEVGSTEFLGYANENAEGLIKSIVVGNAQIDKATAGDEAVIVTNQTPFYGESGGQVGDTGEIRTATGRANVVDTHKVVDGRVVQHIVQVVEGEIMSGQDAELRVCKYRRSRIRQNHSATHLMHAVLQDVLGDHVFQKGSVVDGDRLRFDFSQPKALTSEEIAKIEDEVNKMIWANKPVTTRLMNKDEAVEAGAMALFGEKYDDEVRVLFMGDDEETYSVELCGGTHVERTGDIGLFKISSEESVSAGVRRITALTGGEAFASFRNYENQLSEAAMMMKCPSPQLSTRIESLQKEIKKLKQDVKDAKKAGGSGNSAAEIAKTAEKVGDVTFVGAAMENMEAGDLRALVDELKNNLGSAVIVLASNNGEKASVVAGVTKDLTSTYKAGDIVNAAAAELGGKGGGRPDMAVAGGKAGDLAASLSAAKMKLSA